MYICKSSNDYKIFNPPFVTKDHATLIGAVSEFKSNKRLLFRPHWYIENKILVRKTKSMKYPITVIADVLLKVNNVDNLLQDHPELFL